MSSNDPRPDRLNATPQTKTRPPKKNKAPRRFRASKSRSEHESFTVLAWIAAGLVIVLIALIALWVETPRIKTWLANREHPPKKLTIANPSVPTKPSPPKPKPEEDRLKKLKEQADAETQRLIEQPAPKTPPLLKPVEPPTQPAITIAPASPPAPPVATSPSPSPTNETLPPIAQPVPFGPAGAPARALPLDLNTNKLDTERIAAYQVALERIHFSCGFIDGDQGMRTQRMLRAFQASRDLPVTGVLDQPTRDAIGEPGEPFLSYVVTPDDIASIMPKPTTWREKSQVTRLGYNDIWELLAEKFHCTRAYLKALNHDVKVPVAGTEVIGPKVFPAAPLPKAASLRILLSETSIEALDASGKVIAFFPCSIAKDKNKRPNGALVVKSVVPNPDYTFDPALFADAAKAEGITKKIVLPPGPRNPVGTVWIGLSLPGYGIHGTPEPENISRTQSHGCFRLANWNAEKVLKMVKVGTPVDVEP